jgi:WD40 repeat protein/tetratricopeptide (TPR) repeat protein
MNDELKIENPYVGPRSFENTIEDQIRFFGRTKETKEISSLILSHRVILVYAPSGAGKTSLFNAKIIPKLEKEFNFQVLPVVRVRGIISDTTNPENVFVYNTLLNLEQELNLGFDDNTLPKTSLLEYLKKIPREFDHLDEEPTHLAIIFDQFEELFEYYPEGWQRQREDFFKQVSELCDADPRVRVVFVMREDYLARIRPYEHQLPERLEVRFRIELLGFDQALAAIEKPLSIAKVKRKFIGDASKKLAGKLMMLRVIDDRGKLVSREGDCVLPVQLQVACRTLWENLEPHVEAITEKMVEAYDVDQALADYYESALKSVRKKHPIREMKLRNWFEKKLITPMGTRSTIVMDLDGKTTEGIPNTIVEFLESEMHLVRKSFRRGAPWIELTHDQFVKPIKKANQDNRKKLNRRLFWGSLLGVLLFLWLGFQISVSVINRTTAARVEITATALGEDQVATIQAFEEVQEEIIQARVEEETEDLTEAVETTIEKNRSIELANQANILSEDYSDLGLLLSIEAIRIDNNVNSYSSLLTNLIKRLENISLNKILELEGHRHLVSDIVFSPDGSLVATASWDKTIIIWDLEEGQPDITLEGHAARVHSIAFSPDGKMIASGGLDGLRLWDVETGKQLSEFVTSLEYIYGVAFSPDGQHIAAASWDRSVTDVSSVRLWTISNGDLTLHKKILEASTAYWDVAFSPNSQILAAANNNGLITLWDFQNERIYNTLKGHRYSVNKIIFSSNGQILASTSDDHKIILWDVSSGQPLQSLEGHNDWVVGVDFHPDDKHLVSGSRDGTIRIWNMDSFTPVGNPYEIENPGRKTDLVYVVRFNPSGELLASAIGETNITLWDVNEILPLETTYPEDGLLTSSIGHQLGDHRDDVISAAFSSDNKYIITASENGGVNVWDNGNGQLLTSMSNSRESKIKTVRFYDGDILLLYNDGTIDRWRWEENQIEVLNSESQDIEKVAISQDATLYAAYTNNGEVIVKNVETGFLVFENIDALGVRDLAIDSNNQLLAVGYSSNIVELWDLNSKEIFNTLLGHTDWVESVSFSPDGSLLITTSLDGTSRVWDWSSGEEISLVTHNTGLILGVIGSDNKTLITADVNHSILLWDIDSGSQIGPPLVIHNGTITGLFISPDGKRLVSTSRDNRAILWELSIDELEDLACHYLSRNLTLEELTTYFGKDMLFSQTCAKIPVDLEIILEYARIGEGESAENKLIQAMESDPSIKFAIKEQAYSAARDGNFDEAELFISLLSSVDDSVQSEEELQLARGISLVWEEQYDQAYLAFEAAVEDNDELSAEELLLEEMALRSDVLLDQGLYDEALVLLEEIKQRFPDLIDVPELYVADAILRDLPDPWKRQVQASSDVLALISNSSPEVVEANSDLFAAVFNEVCFWGSLEGYAEEILWACDQAIESAPDSYLYRDSRGLAQALSGNFDAAIEDFRAFIRLAEYNQQYEDMIPSRQLWIEELSAGINPFTEELLNELKVDRGMQ